ncbi:MAG: glycosyltransferase family 9 protein [Vampirovibrionales bacterium]
MVLPRFLGDGILACSLIEALLNGLPDTTSLVVVLPRALHSWVQKLFVTSRLVLWDAHGVKGKQWISALEGISTQCEMAYVFRRSFSEPLWLAMAGVKHRAGFAWQRFPWGYCPTSLALTHAVAYHPYHRHKHELHHWQALVQKAYPPLQAFLEAHPLGFEGLHQRFLGIQPFLTPEHFSRWGLTPAMAGDIHKPLIVIHWATASKVKQRDPLELLPFLLQRLKQVPSRVLLSGSPADEPLYAPLVASLRTHGYTDDVVAVVAGKTLWEDMPLLLLLAQELWSLDSATVHVAALLGAPRVVRVVYAGEVAGSFPERWGILPTSNVLFKSGFTLPEMLSL